MHRRTIVAPFALLLALVACSSAPAKLACRDAGAPALPDGGACPAGQILWTDTMCATNPTGAMTCKDVGDRTCYVECQTDAQCTDPCRPHCRTLGFHEGTDDACAAPRKVCRSEDKNDC
jgi:hypothetical protein